MDVLRILSWGDNGWGDELAVGLSMTLRLAFLAYAMGLVLGMIGAVLKLYGPKFAKRTIEAITTVIRGLPELLIVFMVFYGGGKFFEAVLGLFVTDHRVELNPFAAGVLSLGLVQGAYATDVFRGAIAAVSRGQVEAALIVGMGHSQAFWRIVIPQMLRYAIPGLGHLWIVILKQTALVSVIGLEDLLRLADLAISNTRLPFVFYSAVAVIYIVLGLASMIALNYAEIFAFRGIRTNST